MIYLTLTSKKEQNLASVIPSQSNVLFSICKNCSFFILFYFLIINISSFILKSLIPENPLNIKF